MGTSVCIALSLAAGCASIPKPTLEQKQRGMVFILPGIEGPSVFNRSIAKGLIDGGVDKAVQIFDWSNWAGPLGWYGNLTDDHRHRLQAIHLARLIVMYQKRHPDAPVYLIGHSGGAGIALMAVERLPVAFPVEGVVLLAAAVDPNRDLSAALLRVRRGIWNFHSKRDVGFLVVGTSMFGTMDGAHGVAAGAVGFNTPEKVSPRITELYDQKLHQIGYDPRMAKSGNPGTHTGWTHPRFVAEWLAPIVSGGDIPAAGPEPTASPEDAASADGTVPATTMLFPEHVP